MPSELEQMAKAKRKAYVKYGNEYAEVRVMAEAEGWSMVRRKGAMPFVKRTSELFVFIPAQAIRQEGK